MKRLFAVFFLSSLLFVACKNNDKKGDAPAEETTPQAPAFTQEEAQLVDSLNYSKELVTKIKEYTNAQVTYWMNGDSVFGLRVHMVNNEGITLMKQQESFLDQGYYLLFLGDPTLRDVHIGLTKEKNIYALLKSTGTLSTSDFPPNATRELAAKIEEWNRKGELSIYGAGKDWLKLKTAGVRKDQDEIVQYLAKKCPDMAAYYGGPEGIRRNMDSTGIIELWWE